MSILFFLQYYFLFNDVEHIHKTGMSLSKNVKNENNNYYSNNNERLNKAELYNLNKGLMAKILDALNLMQS